jgi:uncharacterized protein YqcC (DUF446 family)
MALRQAIVAGSIGHYQPGRTEHKSMQTEVAEVLIDIEAQLRQMGQWDKIPPSTEALASSQPFCVDTLTLPQWLQFIFLPTLYRMLEDGQTLPGRCGIAPMAEEFFRGTGLATDQLVDALLRMDEMLSDDAGDNGQ